MEKIREAVKGSFAKSVLMLTGGAVFAQAMNFLLSPVITRIYVPEEYGIMIIYNATLGMVSLLGTLTYELAIPIAEDDEKAINVFALCIMVLLGITGLMVGLLFFFGDFVLGLLNASTITEYKYLIPVGFFGIGLYMTASNWAFRRKNFGIIAKTNYSQSIAGNLTKIGLGLLSFGPVGLIIGRIIAESAGVVTLMVSLVKKEAYLFKKISKREIVWAAKRFVKFPLFSAPTVFLTSLSTQVPVILMSSLYGAKVVGFYGLALTVTFLPVTLVGKAVQDVFYGEAASIGRQRPDRIKFLSDKLMKKLVLLAGAPMLVLILFGPFLFATVFGAEWKEAGVYSRILTVYMFSYFIFHPIAAVYLIFEQQKRFFFLNIVKLGFVLIAFQFVKYFSMGSHLAIFIFSMGMAATELIKYIMAQNILKKAIAES